MSAEKNETDGIVQERMVIQAEAQMTQGPRLYTIVDVKPEHYETRALFEQFTRGGIAKYDQANLIVPMRVALWHGGKSEHWHTQWRCGAVMFCVSGDKDDLDLSRRRKLAVGLRESGHFNASPECTGLFTTGFTEDSKVRFTVVDMPKSNASVNTCKEGKGAQVLTTSTWKGRVRSHVVSVEQLNALYMTKTLNLENDKPEQYQVCSIGVCRDMPTGINGLNDELSIDLAITSRVKCRNYWGVSVECGDVVGFVVAKSNGGGTSHAVTASDKSSKDNDEASTMATAALDNTKTAPINVLKKDTVCIIPCKWVGAKPVATKETPDDPTSLGDIYKNMHEHKIGVVAATPMRKDIEKTKNAVGLLPFSHTPLWRMGVRCMGTQRMITKDKGIVETVTKPYISTQETMDEYQLRCDTIDILVFSTLNYEHERYVYTSQRS